MTGSFLRPCRGRHLFVYNSFTSVTHYSRAAIRISIQKAAGTKSPQYPVENAAANCADCRLFCAPRAAYNSTSSKGCKCMRNWCSRHPVWFMALYALFYLSFFALLERTIQTPDLWVHCPLDDLIPFCKYAIVPYILWFPWIPFTLFYLLYKAPREDFWRLCIPLFTGMTMTLLFYAIVPNGLALRPKYVPGTDIFAQLVRMIYRSDTPMNVCPSIHVFNSVTLMLAYYRSAIFDAPRRRWMPPPPWCCVCRSRCPRYFSSSTVSLTWCLACCWPWRWTMVPRSCREARCSAASAAYRKGCDREYVSSFFAKKEPKKFQMPK